ncbi:MAG TPA: hypothetical protein VJV04_01355 [Nitrospiraceae bacterium]|nr:hypothetical protein [Nitrospiraceae bacterium]
MKRLLIGAAMLAISAVPAFAQSTQGNGADNSNQNLAASQKIKQDLQNAGFTDVKVVAESFVVQAKSKDGDPVLMTIGPHGMSVFEAMNSNNNGSDQSTTGSTSKTNPTSSSPDHNSPSQAR